MKKLIFLFFIAFVCCVTFCLEVKSETKRWVAPKQIRTYIPPNTGRTEMMKHAFMEWSRKTNNRIVFKYVNSPKIAQLRVNFVPVIPNADREIGLTQFQYIPQTGELIFAQIYIADKTSKGQTLGKNSVYTVMLHEIGHAMGMSEHSKDIKSVMYPIENDIQEILSSDLKTLGSIYGW
jgi:hypothetical protein